MSVQDVSGVILMATLKVCEVHQKVSGLKKKQLEVVQPADCDLCKMQLYFKTHGLSKEECDKLEKQAIIEGRLPDPNKLRIELGQAILEGLRRGDIESDIGIIDRRKRVLGGKSRV